jgi:hypothetical protein
MSQTYDPKRRVEALRVAMHALDTSQQAIAAVSCCEVRPGIARVEQPLEIAVRSQQEALLALLESLSHVRAVTISGTTLLPEVQDWLNSRTR